MLLCLQIKSVKVCILFMTQFMKQIGSSLCFSGSIWRHIYGSAWALAMACYLMAPSHCLNQCAIIISRFLGQLIENNLTNLIRFMFSGIALLKLPPRIPGANVLNES